MKEIEKKFKENIFIIKSTMENISIDDVTKEELIDFLETKNVHELKSLLKAAGFKRARYSKLRKPKLIELLVVPPKEVKTLDVKRMSTASIDEILEALADMRKWKIYRTFNIIKRFEVLDVAV